MNQPRVPGWCGVGLRCNRVGGRQLRLPCPSLVKGGRKAGPGIQILPGSLDQGEPMPAFGGIDGREQLDDSTSFGLDSENLVQSFFLP